MKKRSLFKEGGFLMIAVVFGNLLAYIFQVYMGRVLGPAEYSVLGSLTSVFYIISIPISTLTTVVSKFTAQYKGGGEYSKVRAFFLVALKKVVSYGIVVVAVFLALTPFISKFLNLDSNIPLLLLGITLLFSLLLTVSRGTLQGLQMFNQLSLNIILEGSVRLFAGVVLILLGLGVNGAVLSYGVTYSLAFFISFIPLRFIFREKSVGISIPNFYKYSAYVFITFACLTLMTNLDVVLVKHFFSPDLAGYYNVASLLSKVPYFISVALVSIIFPKVSELNFSNKPHKHIFMKSVFFVGSLSVMVGVTYMLFPSQIINLFFGQQYIKAAEFLGLFGIAMALFSTSMILLFYNLALENMAVVKAVVLAAVLEVLLLIFSNGTLKMIVLDLLLTSFVLLVLIIIFARRKNGRVC